MKKRLFAIMLAIAFALSLGAVTAGATTHTVVAGDNLSKIAQQYLGDTAKWQEIYEANKDVIQDPNMICVGQELIIPGTGAAVDPDVPAEPETPVSAVTPDVPLRELTANPEDADYDRQLLATELYNYKIIRNIPTAYENEAWNGYCSVASALVTMNAESLSELDLRTLSIAHDLRLELIQIKSYADCAWMIWGDDIATVTPDEELLFNSSSQDNEDFVPYLVPYLLDDQENVKGNVILVSGGGMAARNNTQEGYPSATRLNELGYNCYVLQRRVSPYRNLDTSMDLQRSIRYIRYYGEDLGLGGLDCIAAAGFSGGSTTVLGCLDYTYGDILPSDYDADYVADEIDLVNSDLDIAICIYGPWTLAGVAVDGVEVPANENLPAILLIAGAEDEYGAAEGNHALYSELTARGAIVEMYTFAQNPHGFGPGKAGTNSVNWPMLADVYMQQITAFYHTGSGEDSNAIPEQYTKYQEYTVAAPFGDVDITCAVNDEETEFYITFSAFNEDQIISGKLIDGIVVVEYDKSGFFAGDAQNFFDGSKSGTWKKMAPAIPEDYTKYQQYTVTAPFGDVDITCAVNADESAFYITFNAFNEDQIIFGKLIQGIVIVEYDKSGFFAGDAQNFFDGSIGGIWIEL